MQQHFGSGGVRQIAFVGPFGVGKTTAVRAISASPTIDSEAPSSRELSGRRQLKATTTVGLEYGDWTTPDGRSVDVVGTPGQARFDDVRRAALLRSTGVVLWLYGHHDAAPLDCALWLDLLRDDGVRAAQLTVVVTRLTDPAATERFRPAISARVGDVPLLAADPRNRGDVEQVLLVTAKRTIASLEVRS